MPEPKRDEPSKMVPSVTDIEEPEFKQEKASEIGTLDDVFSTGMNVQNKMTQLYNEQI